VSIFPPLPPPVNISPHFIAPELQIQSDYFQRFFPLLSSFPVFPLFLQPPTNLVPWPLRAAPGCESPLFFITLCTTTPGPCFSFFGQVPSSGFFTQPTIFSPQVAEPSPMLVRVSFQFWPGSCHTDPNHSPTNERPHPLFLLRPYYACGLFGDSTIAFAFFLEPLKGCFTLLWSD